MQFPSDWDVKLTTHPSAMPRSGMGEAVSLLQPAYTVYNEKV